MTMQVTDQAPRAQYTAIAAQQSFSVPFEWRFDSHLKVYVDGALKVLNTDYTLDGAGETGGGDLEFASAMIGDEIVTIYRDMPIARTSEEYSTGGNMPALVLEASFDDATMRMQQLEVAIARALRLAPYDPSDESGFQLPLPAARAGKFLYFDSSGVPELVTSIGATVISQSIIAGLLDPQTPAELAAGVTPVNLQYHPGNVLRYGTNTTPGTTDMTAAFQNAALANDHVIVPDGDYLLSDSIALRAGMHFEMAGGVLLKASVRDWGATGLLRAVGVSGITITGGVLDGQKASNPTGECFGIDLRGALNVRIRGTRAINMPGADVTGTTGGDGLYIGYDGTEANPCRNVIVEGFIADGNCRQGCSVVGVVGLKFVGCDFLNATGTNPGGGVDIEANGATENLSDISFSGCRFEGNYYGLVVTTSAKRVTIGADCTWNNNRFIDVYIADCSHVTWSGGTIRSTAKDAACSLVEINSAEFVSIGFVDAHGSMTDANERAGFNVTLGSHVTLAQCRAYNMRTQGFIVGNSSQPASFSDVELNGCVSFDCVDPSVAATAPFTVSGNSGGGFYPADVRLIGCKAVDSRSAGDEAEFGFSISTSIPAATRAEYRMEHCRSIGPTAFMQAGTSPPLTAIFTWNPGSLIDAAGETSASITVTGAALGDYVEVYPPYDLQDILCTGYVQAANTVEVRLQNEGAATVDLGNSAAWRVKVRKFFE